MKNVKVMITRTTAPVEPGTLTLKECGFKVGDVVEIDGYYRDGSANTRAIREGEGIRIGDNIGLSAGEFVVVEVEV
jgi:hypothetical protein